MRELFGRVCTGVLVLSGQLRGVRRSRAVAAAADATQAPGDQHQRVAKLIEELHYSQPRLDNSLSSAILDHYLDTLDGNRMYFTAGDVASFNRLRYELDDRTRTGELQPVFDIFNLFRKRAGERVEYAIALLATEPDYTLDESFAGIAASCRGPRRRRRDRRSLAQERQERRPAAHADGQDLGRGRRDSSRSATSARTSASRSSRPTTCSRRT